MKVQVTITFDIPTDMPDEVWSKSPTLDEVFENFKWCLEHEHHGILNYNDLNKDNLKVKEVKVEAPAPAAPAVNTNVFTAERVAAELKQAIKDFGTYSFDDKGPEDVMDVENLARDLLKLPAADAATELRKLAKMKGFRPLSVAQAILWRVDDWDELLEQPGMQDICDGKKPR